MKKKKIKSGRSGSSVLTRYPYIPEGKSINYVPETNKYMFLARKIAEESGCVKQPTGAVIVKDSKVLSIGNNSGKKVNVCPRSLVGSKTGENYHLCREICKQNGHSEQVAVQNAKKKGTDTRGADMYLWGHWWCCEPCWNAIISVGINRVFLQLGSEREFNPLLKIKKIYISGALSKLGPRSKLKIAYEKIGGLVCRFCPYVYIPHLRGTDPIKNSEVPSGDVWKRDFDQVSSAELTIAYVGKPSLEVGAELEIARASSKDIIIWWYKGEKVSRMARGNPAVIAQIEAVDDNHLLEELGKLIINYGDGGEN